MNLDDLKTLLAEHDRKLDRLLASDECLRHRERLRGVRSALAPHVLWRAIEAACCLVALVALVPVVVAHIHELRHAIAGTATCAYFAAGLAASVHLLVLGVRLDYAGAVAGLQRHVERLRAAEYRVLQWAVLGGVVVWLPALLLFVEVATSAPLLTRVDGPWLWANLGFGLAVLTLGRWLSRRYVERSDLGPTARRFVDAMTGRGVQRAAAHLAEIDDLTRPDPQA